MAGHYIKRTCVVCKQEFSRKSFSNHEWVGSDAVIKCVSCATLITYQSRNKSLHAYLKYSWGNLKRKRKNSTTAKYVIDPDIDVDLLIKLWNAQKGLCAVTRLPMTWSIVSKEDISKLRTNVSVDRIHNDIGYTTRNIRLVCAHINHMKGTTDDSELYWWSRAIVESLTKEQE